MKNRDRILGVADRSESRVTMARVLGDDYDLRIASSGEQCLKVVADFYPELIVLDITEPGIHNCEVVRLLRWNSRLKKIGIIMLADSVSEMEWARDNHPGPDDYLKKPFVDEVLRQRVRELLRLRALEKANRLKGDMIELIGERTGPPLGIISEIAESLRKGGAWDERKLKEAGASVRRSAEDLNILIENAYTMVEFETADRRVSGPVDR